MYNYLLNITKVCCILHAGKGESEMSHKKKPRIRVVRVDRYDGNIFPVTSKQMGLGQAMIMADAETNRRACTAGDVFVVTKGAKVVYIPDLSRR